ncbi:sigma 54-interacting transcriptional regulator [Myxococcota bacterium]|nr:sigma 54-interacting transcriptional regulator [Myxococcota bacterium]MBU1509801.1 sigma 54-interacting transcriptional regulator [Myxococcota bacterium]
MPGRTDDKTAPLPRDPSLRPPEDLCLWDPLADAFFPLDRRPRLIGKDPACEVRLTHGTVSRRHARLEWTPEGHVLLDLDSSNGVFRDGLRVTRTPLLVHGTVMLGGAPLVVTPSPPTETLRRRFGERFFTRSARFCRLLQLAEKVASGTQPVLVAGETGTGKEWLARFLHERSPRASAPLVAVNCGALARDLLESELFGHARGAFTGAEGPRAGLISRAAGGTLFLDEIGELRPDHQAALLRFLENRTYRPVGSDRELTSDARIVAATHADLAGRAAAGLFREDLLYRLMDVRLELPPLRERKADLPLLAEAFNAPELPDWALARLLGHDWPGNLRQLRHVFNQIRLFGPEIALADLRTRPETTLPEAVSGPRQLKDLEKEMILSALARQGNNTSAAARSLELPRSTLVNRMKSMGIG